MSYTIFGCRCTGHPEDELHSEQCTTVCLADGVRTFKIADSYARFFGRFGVPDKGRFPYIEIYKGKDVGHLVKAYRIISE